jgi:hypothetical protein
MVVIVYMLQYYVASSHMAKAKGAGLMPRGQGFDPTAILFWQAVFLFQPPFFGPECRLRYVTIVAPHGHRMV